MTCTDMTDSFLERRKFFRHPLNVPVKIRRLGRRAVGLRTNNLSMGGLHLVTKQAWEQGERVELSFPLKDVRCKLRGRVAHCRQAPRKRSFEVGLEFTDADSAFRAKLAQEVLEIERYRHELERLLRRQVSEQEASKKWVAKRAKEFSELFREFAPGS
jgi:c-di-GMP-binding flagellar brake protein YcgR